MRFTFNYKYFIAAVALLILEVFIAVYVKDSIVRPYGGDFLVVILLYSVLKSFVKIPVKNAIFGVLLFSWLVEALQYINITKVLNLERNKIISVILGSHFEWLDVFIYTLAALTIYFLEQIKPKTFQKVGKRS